MRRVMPAVAGLLLLLLAPAPAARAQTADEIVAKYVKTIGGMERLRAIKSLRRTGKFTGGGGFEAVVVDENRRPGMVRSEFSLQGMTGVYAYDGRTGWKIEPWNGKKDAEALGEEELRGLLEDSDIDGPLINYKEGAGVYLPHFFESGQKGSPNKSQVTYAKIEANVALDDARFRKPGATGESPTAPDASETQPKKPEDQKPPAEAPKPPTAEEED